MTVNDKPVLIYATCPDVNVAQRIAEPLVARGLVACVNIVPGMMSVYRWRGDVQTASECVVLIKTRRSLADAVIADARARHPYDEPAFVVLPIDGGAAGFLSWIMSETAAPAAAAPNAQIKPR